MKAKDFVDKIQKLKPSEEDFKNTNISKSFVERSINEFEIIQVGEKKNTIS
ncbi:hypothetical protein ACS5PU_06720 [Pedobacter sp. GSP4]|uniref:hypothetical protein n=1 Tax=Pedobacter sp. GSP4 TaxID=3453716 RepID=UPI003EEED2A3